MGGIASKSGELRRPASSLSPDEKAAIKASWAAFTPKAKDVGVAFFTKLFTDHPEYQKTFGRVKDVPLADLGTSKAMSVHAQTFMKGLGTLVEQIDDPDSADEMLWKIAVRHKPFNLKITDMQKATDIFVGIVNGSDQASSAAAWKHGFEIVMPIIEAYTQDAIEG